jgi:iron complex outermembrane receptor protein
MKTPVVISTVTAQQIKDRHVRNMDALAEIIPDLKIQRGFGGSVGAVAYVRGIGSGTSATFIDQSVGFAIDDVGYSHGAFYDASTFDLAQVNLLKGPQGLYYGKSTTAGIISFTTADPTPTWESEVSTAYEINAHETDFNGYVSGPITDHLSMRLAGFYTSMDGYLYNPNPAGAPNQRRVPDGDGGGFRLTLKYQSPGGRFHARFKVGGAESFSHGEQEALRQFASCPLGHPQNSFFKYDNCTLDQYNIGETPFPPYNPNIDWINSAGNKAAFAAYSPFPGTGDGTGYITKKALISSLLLDYEIEPGLTLTSVTGYGGDKFGTQQQGAINSLGTYQLISPWSEDDWSEEVRLTSNWRKSWLNFMVGGLYAPSQQFGEVDFNIPAITRWVNDYNVRKIRTTSVFGQLLFTPIEQVEIAAGLRWTRVHEYLDYLAAISNVVGFRPGDPGAANFNQAPLLPYNLTNFTQNNTSPEFTVTWRPTDLLTLYASYKFGYKGPGYNVNGVLNTTFLNPGSVQPFGGEKVQGGEGGIKAALLDHHMNFTLAVYDYRYIGLQVSHYDALLGRALVSNGADADTKGVEVNINYRPEQVPGLQLDAFVTYNNAYYSSFPTSPCYGGQTPATGCMVVKPGVTEQDLTGRTLSFAPKWVGSVEANYTRHLTSSLIAGIDGVVSFSSGYNYTPALSPDGYQGSWATFDASIHVGKDNGAWDVALIGRNLTDERYVVTGFDAGTFTPGVVSDTQGIANRSQQIVLQLTLRPELLIAR